MNSVLKNIFSQNCYMLDVESTGLDIYRNGITSFALVRFNLHQPIFQNVIENVLHAKISSSLNFDLEIKYDNDEFRQEHHIDEDEARISTLNHIRNNYDLNRILSKHAIEYQDSNHLFCLHTDFDAAFIKKYFNYLKVDFPFNHRNVWDIASLTAGFGQSFQHTRRLIEEHCGLPELSWLSSKENMHPHNAVYDCFIQIYTMWTIFRYRKNIACK